MFVGNNPQVPNLLYDTMIVSHWGVVAECRQEQAVYFKIKSQFLLSTSCNTDGSSENLDDSLISLSRPPFWTITFLLESLPANLQMKWWHKLVDIRIYNINNLHVQLCCKSYIRENIF